MPFELELFKFFKPKRRDKEKLTDTSAEEYHADMSVLQGQPDLPAGWSSCTPHSPVVPPQVKPKDKAQDKITNGANRMQKALNRQIEANTIVGNKVEKIMRCGFSLGVGITTLGAWQIGLPLIATAALGEGINKSFVTYNNNKLEHTKEVIDVCFKNESTDEEKTKACQQLKTTSRYIRLFEGTSRVSSRVMMVFLGNAHTVVDLVITAFESKNDFTTKVKQPFRNDECFENGRREFMSGMAKILKRDAKKTESSPVVS